MTQPTQRVVDLAVILAAVLLLGAGLWSGSRAGELAPIGHVAAAR